MVFFFSLFPRSSTADVYKGMAWLTRKGWKVQELLDIERSGKTVLYPLTFLIFPTRFIIDTARA